MPVVKSYTFQNRRDTSANWTANNPILRQGEPGYETDTGRHKYGDGLKHWNELPYFNPSDIALKYGPPPEGLNLPPGVKHLYIETDGTMTLMEGE